MKGILFVLSLLSILLSPTDVKRSEARYIVVAADGREERLERALRAADGVYTFESIYPGLNIYRVHGEGNEEEMTSHLKTLQDTGIIESYRFDQKVELRSTPNDPLWLEQWDMAQIDMERAWDITTGGLTPDGDTIVVAVLDAGYQTDHPDLGTARWVNRGEIPGDGIDNDNNGYIDDYEGLNLDTGQDDHPSHYHGSGVSGIIAASGNNLEGIAGVNWNVKILPISNIRRESDIIEGYNYARRMRDLYNATNGAEGAFVVATNLSAGIDGAFAEDYPEWCATYDDMGASGILSIAATTNSDRLVDEEGDMPSTCSSAFLVTVTNTNMSDEKVVPAGYGPVHVDLGAPGTSSKTTSTGIEYQDFPGTSAAAPHVAGVAALAYSVPCSEFMEIVRQNPMDAARIVRSVILMGVDRNANLEEFTQSGGRLNAYNTLTGIQAYCGDFNSGLNFLNAAPNPSRGVVDFTYVTPDLKPNTWYVFDVVGRLVFSEDVIPSGVPVLTHSIDFSNFATGVYIVHLEGENASVSTRVVIQ